MNIVIAHIPGMHEYASYFVRLEYNKARLQVINNFVSFFQTRTIVMYVAIFVNSKFKSKNVYKLHFTKFNVHF